MMKKLLAALFAVLLTVSIAATALAAPDETPAPVETAAPAAVPVDPAVFAEQVNTLVTQMVAMKEQLAQERQLDRKLMSDIRSLKGFYTPDPKLRKAYEDEMRPLEKTLSKLTAQLKTEQRKTRKHTPDQNKIASIQKQIDDVNAKIAAVDTKYPGMKDSIKANRSSRSTLKPFREQLKKEYAKLKPYFKQAGQLNEQMHKLMGQLKDAIKANDLTKASDLLTQLNAVVTQLNGNIAQRIAIREGITKMLTDYKASLTK